LACQDKRLALSEKHGQLLQPWQKQDVHIARHRFPTVNFFQAV